VALTVNVPALLFAIIALVMVEFMLFKETSAINGSTGATALV
jgi:hypothetical protein